MVSRSHKGEEELADAEHQPGGEEPDDDAAGPARASAIGPHADGDAREEGQRVDSEGEEQPADDADGCDAQENAKYHGGVLRKMKVYGRAFHHHHGAKVSIAEVK